MKVTFITGNQNKADFLAKYLGQDIAHKKLELDEIQSLNLREIAKHKAHQAHAIIKSPVLVEDVGMVIYELKGLPGPFIKWFIESIGLGGICELVDGLPNRRATIMVCAVYFDGAQEQFFYGELSGTISATPRGDGGFGFDSIFIPDTSQKTLAEMSETELKKNSLRTTTIYPELKKFLSST